MRETSYRWDVTWYKPTAREHWRTAWRAARLAPNLVPALFAPPSREMVEIAERVLAARTGG